MKFLRRVSERRNYEPYDDNNSLYRPSSPTAGAKTEKSQFVSPEKVGEPAHGGPFVDAEGPRLKRGPSVHSLA